MSAAWNAMPQFAAGLVGQLLRASIAGGLLVLLVWLLCRACPRLSPVARAWIWWLASLKFLVVLLAIPALPLPVLPGTTAGLAAVSSEAGLTRGTLALPAPLSGTASAAGQTATLAPSHRWREAAPVGLVLLWVTGLGVALMPAGRDLRKARAARMSSRPVTDPQLHALFARLCEDLGVRNAQLRAIPGDGSPRVTGLLRPLVLMPEGALRSLSQDELEWVLSHELFHLRRKDLWLGLLPALIERLFYFHPLARLASREYGSARESACDAGVLAGRNPSPRAYGQLLVKLGVRACPPSSAAALVDRKSLKRRLEMLHQITQMPRLRRSWPFILLALFAMVPLRLVATDAGSEPGTRATRDAPQSKETRMTAPTPPTAPSPPTPTVDVVAAPAPPAAPQAPTAGVDEPPAAAQSASDLSFVFLRKDHTVSNHAWVDGSTADVSTARALRHGEESLLYVRTKDGAWVIRDPRILQKVDAAFEPQRELGRQQADLGRQQAEIGRQQAELGKAQAELGGQQAELGRQQAELGAQQSELAARQASLEARLARITLDRAAASEGTNDDDSASAREDELRRQLREVSEQQRRLADQQRALGERQGALGSRQGALGEQQRPLADKQRPLATRQRELATRQRAAALQARRELRQIVEQAVAAGQAEAVQ